MKKTAKFTDKAYRLLGDSTPLSYMLPTRHTKRFPILHFDEETGINRELRYSTNQKSIYVDEQDENVILEAIIFEDGLLYVRKNNQILQQFLEHHPLKGRMFEVINNEKDAEDVVEILNQEVDALVEARSLSVEQLVEVGRVLFGNVTKKSTAEIRRDVLVFARNEPAEFLNIISDPQLKFTAQVQAFFDNGLILKKGKDIFFNTKSNKKRMVVIPAGEDEVYIVSSYLQSEEGEQSFKLLEKTLEN